MKWLPAKRTLYAGMVILLILVFAMWLLYRDAHEKYEAQLSVVVFDRHQVPLSVKENVRGHYVLETTKLPEDFKSLLIKKEDKYFTYHPGINPFSMVRAFSHYLKNGRADGSSTITQQLAKNLLGTETNRTITNKIVESLYAVSIELFASKEEMLTMYANTVYLGNQVQGFETASYAYFGKPLMNASHSEQIALLATLSHPSTRNPWEENVEYSVILNNHISPEEIFVPPVVSERYSLQQDAFFELKTATIDCDKTCTTTIDNNVTQGIRNILSKNIDENWYRNVRNGAVVVLDAHTSELIAMVGTRNPQSDLDGDQINMALAPRPIGSTVKPFVYAKGFELGLRPYTLVEDREYKYPIATGYSLYPKNYDGLYHGEITLHEALSNSFNVPSVKVLEYIGLDNFYAFLSDNLHFTPIQEFESYQYGIALGGLEMDLLTLTHYFTLFPQEGSLSPLKIMQSSQDNFSLPPQSNITEKTDVIDEKYIELVHAIISDRYTGVNQFGLEGNLNLTHTEYGVKTGTSRDFHDSWVVGYTPDFVVGVWLGNAENKPLEQVSGARGAGAVWHDIMQYLLATEYNKNTSFSFDYVTRIPMDGSDEWGLQSDIVEEHTDLLSDDTLILSIHPYDTFVLEGALTIPLNARKDVTWSVNGRKLSVGRETVFKPTKVGTYEIVAFDSESQTREVVPIVVTELE